MQELRLAESPGLRILFRASFGLPKPLDVSIKIHRKVLLNIKFWTWGDFRAKDLKK